MRKYIPFIIVLLLLLSGLCVYILIRNQPAYNDDPLMETLGTVQIGKARVVNKMLITTAGKDIATKIANEFNGKILNCQYTCSIIFEDADTAEKLTAKLEAIKSKYSQITIMFNFMMELY
jgi:hypothetical protein